MVISMIESMNKIVRAAFCGGFTLFLILAVNGCQTSSSQEGIHVMFDGIPKIYHDQIYFHNQVVGSVQEKQGGNGSVTKVTIRIDPKFEQQSGRHWAFYVDNGRLIAEKLSSFGDPIGPGDRVCGFHSKMDFTWFKVRTLLSHRISKANRRAEKLYLKFTQSG